MKLHVHSKAHYIRLEFEGSDPWNSQNFFQQLDAMFSTCKEVYNQRPRPVVFDFSNASRVDSSIITLVIQVLRLTEEKHSIAIVSPNEDTMSLFHLMGFGKLTELYSSMEEYESDSQN